MTSYLLLLVCALFSSLGSCSQEAPELVYISTSFEGAHSPYSVVYQPLDGVINFRDANDNEGHCHLQSDGVYPSLSCKCSLGKCGVLLYDGYSFLDIQKGDFEKDIYRKGVALVFYDRSDPTVLSKLKEAAPKILSNEVHLPYFPLRNKADKEPMRNSRVTHQDFEMFHKADEAVQVSLGASLEMPHCYVAFVDPPRSAHYASRKRPSSLPLRTTSDSANVVYMSPHPPAPETLRLHYSPLQRTINVEYNQDSQRFSSVLAIMYWNRHLPIRAVADRYISGCVFFDGKDLSYTGDKKLDGRRNAMIAYQPETGISSYSVHYRIAGDLQRIFEAAGFFETWDLDVDTFKRLDAEVQSIIAKHNPSHPRGYFVVIDPALPRPSLPTVPYWANLAQTVTEYSTGDQSQLSSAGSLVARLSDWARLYRASSVNASTTNIPVVAPAERNSTIQPPVLQQLINVSVASPTASEVTTAVSDARNSEDEDLENCLPGQHYVVEPADVPSPMNDVQDQQPDNTTFKTKFERAVINIRGRATLSVIDDLTMTLQSKSVPEDRVTISISQKPSTTQSGRAKSLIFYPGQDFNPLGAVTVTPSNPCAFVLLWFGDDFSPKHLEPLRGINQEISALQMRDVLEDFIENDGISCPLVLIKITLSTENMQ